MDYQIWNLIKKLQNVLEVKVLKSKDSPELVSFAQILKNFRLRVKSKIELF